MENKDIILFILVIVVVYLLYRDICNRREKFAETTSSTSSSTGAKPTTTIPTKNGESMSITEAIKNLGIIAKQLQKDNNFVFPGNLTVEGKLTVKESIEIPDVIDFGKETGDEYNRRLVEFAKGLDINMNNNHIRDTQTIYCREIKGINDDKINIGSILNLNNKEIHGVSSLYTKNTYAHDLVKGKTIQGEKIQSDGDIVGNNIYVNGLWTDKIAPRGNYGEAMSTYKAQSNNKANLIHVVKPNCGKTGFMFFDSGGNYTGHIGLEGC